MTRLPLCSALACLAAAMVTGAAACGNGADDSAASDAGTSSATDAAGGKEASAPIVDAGHETGAPEAGDAGDAAAVVRGTDDSPPPPSIPADAAKVTCLGGTADDASAIQAALATSAAVVLSGTCNLGTTTVKLAASQLLAGPATLMYSGTGYAVSGSDSGDTVMQLIFDGGGLDLDASGTQAGWTIVYNTFENIVSGANGVTIENILGKGAPSRISNNTFTNIWKGGYPNLPAGTDAGSCGQDCIDGGGIYWQNGLDATTIDHNVMDQIGFDGIKGFWDGFIGRTDPYLGHGVVISNNVITHYHRIAIEVQGTGSDNCPGGCDYSLPTTDGTQIKGNYVHLPALDNNQFAFSLMVGGTNTQLIDNTGNNDVTDCAFRAGIGLENGIQGGIIQGNVIGAVPQSCSTVGWADFVASGYASGTNYYSNNLLCGPGAAAQGTVNNGEDPDDDATQIETADLWVDTCPAAPDLATSKIALTLASGASDAGDAGAGALTWTAAVVSNLSIRSVRFYLDDSATAFVKQEVSDVSRSFPTDLAWRYHASIDAGTLATLAAGAHTVTAIATDASGATETQAVTFSGT